MKTIIFNDYNLDDNQMIDKVIRVKGLIINSNGNILLAHNNNTYQFPGGHLEDNEDMDDCIIREIMEETGIFLEVKEEPFLCIKTYDNNYFNTGKKVLCYVYYYRFFTDKMPDLSKTHYDELEIATDFNLYYIVFSDLRNFLKKAISNDMINPAISREMIAAIDVYNEVYGGI